MCTKHHRNCAFVLDNHSKHLSLWDAWTADRVLELRHLGRRLLDSSAPRRRPVLRDLAVLLKSSAARCSPVPGHLTIRLDSSAPWCSPVLGYFTTPLDSSTSWRRPVLR